METPLWIEEHQTEKANVLEVCYVCEHSFTQGVTVIESVYGDIVCSEACQEDYEERQNTLT